MSKVTMSDIIRDREQNREKVARLDERITALAADIATYEAEAEAEAARGNVDGYSAHKAKAEQAQIEAHVAQAQRKQMQKPAADDATVRKAWANYVDDYRKDVLPAVKAYEKAKAELEAQYMRLVERQNAALKMRKVAAEMLGRKITEPPTDYDFAGLAELDYISKPNGKPLAELEFFAHDNREKYAYINRVVCMHGPVGEI